MSLLRSAFFFKSVASLADAPASVGEIAFVGRSNTGKSSAINALTGSQLAFVSKTPGRTRLINYYALGAERFIVDLPGYGYARVPDATRAPWEKLLGCYLRMRAPLRGLAVVMDVRHPLTELGQRVAHVHYHGQAAQRRAHPKIAAQQFLPGRPRRVGNSGVAVA